MVRLGYGFLLLVAAAPTRAHLTSLPQSHFLGPRVRVCVWTPPLSIDEFFTTTVFVSRGSELRAEVEIDGPHTFSLEHTATSMLHVDMLKGKNAPVVSKESVDFSKIAKRRDEEAIKFWLEQKVRREYEGEVDVDDEGIYSDDPQRLNDRVAEGGERAEGPIAWSRTIQVLPGKQVKHINRKREVYYYRVCVKSLWNEITAEIDIRRSSDVLVEELPHDVGLDHEEGHVRSYAHADALRHRLAEKKIVINKIEEDAEVGGKDLHRLHLLVLRLRSKLDHVQGRQVGAERQLISLREAEGERSSGAMALRSLLHTVVFMGISAFQIFSIRRWFKNHAPLPYRARGSRR